MIDRPLAHADQPTLPVPAGIGRWLVLGSVFVCAACGLVYELELVALASYVVGDSVTQASVVLSVMVFAMGVGSLVVKWVRCHPAVGFGCIEALLALIGGSSGIALYATFAWLGEARLALVGFSFVIGLLIGAEMPLLMGLIQRIRAQDARGAVADLFAADYVGALVGGLAFPFLLLPFLGQLTGSLLTGIVNALVGGVVVVWLFRRELDVRGRRVLLFANLAAVLLLLCGSTLVGPFERAAQRAVYGDDVRVAVRSARQEVVLTGGTGGNADTRTPSTSAASPASPVEPVRWRGAELRLFLDGRLRARSSWQARFHQALVQPAMGQPGGRARVLVLGGGDGLALREVLRYRDVERVTVVEQDPAVSCLGRTDPGLRRLNAGAFADPRVRVASADPFNWLRTHGSSGPEGEVGTAGGRGAERYDVILGTLPDPVISEYSKLYSREFYGLAARALAPGGRLAVHTGQVRARAHDFWTVERTIGSVGLTARPYLVPPANGARAADEWGFVLAERAPARGRGETPQAGPAAPAYPEGGRSAGLFRPAALRAAELRAARTRLDDAPTSTLMHPRYVG